MNNINEKDTEAMEKENHSETQRSDSGHHHDGGHHHGSGRHHSEHRHSHDSERKKKKKKMNPKLRWTLLGLLTVMLVALVFIFETLPGAQNPGGIGGDPDDAGDLTVQVINQEGFLVKEAVRKYLLTDLLNSYNASARPSDFSKQEGRLDAQVPVSLKLSMESGVALVYKIDLADNDRFLNATASYIDGSDSTYAFEHLYANTKYFYRVTVYTNNGSESVGGSFQTSDTPRILSVDGLSNVRDIGNWRTDSGKRIKQGLLFRGTEMDGAFENVYHLTNEGLQDMLGALGIRMDMDLRAQTAMTQDALGSRVEHRYYAVDAYGQIFSNKGKEKIRAVFGDLANPDHYPIYMHCTYGRDRTGTVCYLLEALLGVSRGDCLKEYGLSDIGIENILAIENGLKAYEGATLKEQTESYLLSCGVSEYQIESIRNIFLGD